MAIPYIKMAYYTDDGCNVYQCLQCKAEWEARSGNWIFCPGCGIRFVGQKEGRERHQPKWLYKLGSWEEQDKARNKLHEIYSRQELAQTGWLIEYKICTDNLREDDYRRQRPEWQFERWIGLVNYGRRYDPASVLEELRKIKANFLEQRLEYMQDEAEDADFTWVHNMYPERTWRVRITTRKGG